MVRCRATRTFTDVATGRLVVEGSELECPPQVADGLVRLGVAEPAAAPPRPHPARKQVRKKRK